MFHQFYLICGLQLVHIYIEIYPKTKHLYVLICSKSFNSDIEKIYNKKIQTFETPKQYLISKSIDSMQSLLSWCKKDSENICNKCLLPPVQETLF